MLRASAARRGARTRLYGVYHFPEEVIRRIADFRISEKSDPLYYARPGHNRRRVAATGVFRQPGASGPVPYGP